jgi:signal transduction histidine kinase
MGIGLSIARTIIQAHHGRIWAENRVDGEPFSTCRLICFFILGEGPAPVRICSR